MFDIEKKISDWKVELADAGSITSEDIAELEAHLRENLTDLLSKGLSEKESFVLATMRLGSPSALNMEYCKVNGKNVWRKRIMWMLFGYLGGSAFGTSVSGIIAMVASTSALAGATGVTAGAIAVAAAATCWTVLLVALYFRARQHDVSPSSDRVSILWLAGFPAFMVAGSGLGLLARMTYAQTASASDFGQFGMTVSIGTLAINICVMAACIGMIAAIREAPKAQTETIT